MILLLQFLEKLCIIVNRTLQMNEEGRGEVEISEPPPLFFAKIGREN